MKYRTQEILFSFFMLAVGCGLMMHAFSPAYELMAQDLQSGPMAFPKVILTGWIICSFAMVVRSLYLPKDTVVPFKWLRCFTAVGVMACFVFFFEKLGNMPCATFCFFGLGLILGHKKPLRLLVISVAYGIFIDLLFRYALKLYLPSIPDLV